MDTWRSRMILATALSMPASYHESHISTLKAMRMNFVEAGWQIQAEPPEARKDSNSSKPLGLDSLPDGKGKDVTVRLCTKCHSVNVFVLQRHNLDGWYNVIDQMTGKGLQASDQDIEIVARYLASSFPASADKSENQSNRNLSSPAWSK